MPVFGGTCSGYPSPEPSALSNKMLIAWRNMLDEVLGSLKFKRC